MTNCCAPLVAALICAATVVPALGQQPSPQTFRGGRDVLVLEASVRDKDGVPVTDLQAPDFTVTIDGRPRRVLSARPFGVGRDDVVRSGSLSPRFVRTADTTAGRVILVAVDRESIASGAEKPMLDSAAALLATLSPADAIGVYGLPTGGVDLTRDHAAAAAALRSMTGMRERSQWTKSVSYEEALAFERRDERVIAEVIERECTPIELDCPPEVGRQARQLRTTARAQTQRVLGRIADAIDSLGALRAPRRLVLFSGGLPFGADLVQYYDEVRRRAARARVSLFIVHVDQPDFDASTRRNIESVVGGRAFTSGLADLAATTGGTFALGVGTGRGALERIVSDIGSFYELGIEWEPADAEEKVRPVAITVSRPGLTVRTPAEIAGPPPAGAIRGVAAALQQPTDISEVPFEVAAFSTHGASPDRVRVIVAVSGPGAAVVVPAEWGYVVTRDGREIGGGREEVPRGQSGRWTGTSSIEVTPGRLRVRAAVVAADGRLGSIDVPVAVGLRAVDTALMSDLVVGAAVEGTVQPRAVMAASEPLVGLLELTPAASLTDIAGTLELTRGGTPRPMLRQALAFEPRASDPRILVAQAAVDLAEVPPAVYTVSAVLSRAGQPLARIDRIVEITTAPTAPRVTAPAPSVVVRDPVLQPILERVGRYVDGYGEAASLIVATEEYEQRINEPPLGVPSERKLMSVFALSRATDATGWIGYRDVLEVDGRPVSDRADRLMSLLGSGTPDLAGARRVAAESARYNIGPAIRNFNDPTAVLFFFRSSRLARFAFESRGTETINGVRATQISFREIAKPTLIQTSMGRDIACSGMLWVNPEDGTVLRTRIDLTGYQGLRSGVRVEVTFARDPRLRLWLPSRMTEQNRGVVQAPGATRLNASIVEVTMKATATYRDFKRFETDTSILVK